MSDQAVNIIITTPQMPTPEFPSNVYVFEQAQALHRQGHKVAVLCAVQGYGRKSKFVFGETSYGKESLPAIRVEYPIVRGASYVPCVIGLMLALRKVNRYFRPDLIHAHVALPVGFASVVCGKVLGLPVVVTEHWGPVRQLCNAKLSEWSMRFTASNANAMIAVSDHLKQEIISELRTARQISVVPNLYDPAKFYPVSNNNGNTPQSRDILFVGRGGDARKGNDLALKAFARALHQSSMRARLVLVGKGLEQELTPVAQELGVASYCLFTGALSSEELAAVMRRSAFLVVASHYETFGLVLVEAMACGKPVIATRCGGPEELVKPETGLLVPANDVEALAQAMIEMSRTLPKYDAHTIARYASENYGEDIVARQLTGLYESLVLS